MRVVVDYGLNTPLAKPPIAQSPRGAAARPDSGTAAGADGTDGAQTVTRRESVVVVNFGPAREDAAARAESGLGGARASGPGTGVGETGGPGAGGAEGIPIPGTPYELTTSEDAKARDRAVRGHEQAHLLSLGPYAASGVTLSTRLGPDGERYAVGGSIRADLSEVPGDPRATLRKANAVRRAAFAPGSPSSADMRVAADAYRLAREAREELEAQRLDRSS
ncbi:MAG: hypothetical protein GVY14_04140 [Spirochaetes bacterium]|nr:hypothetical protein [Spirochaetota bacterium]